MKKIKFVNKDRAQFTVTLRKNVNEYFKNKGISTKGNWKMMMKAVSMLSIYLAPFALILFFTDARLADISALRYYGNGHGWYWHECNARCRAWLFF